jgi:hypothetical protein
VFHGCLGTNVFMPCLGIKTFPRLGLLLPMAHLHNYSFFFFWDRVSLCSSGWPQTCDTLALASWVLGLQKCTTMPSLQLFFLRTLSLPQKTKGSYPPSIYGNLFPCTLHQFPCY